MVENLKNENQDLQKNEVITKLKKELLVNSMWDIIENEGKFYVVDCYGEKWYIDVELRKKLPNSYFHSPECDNDIIGYDPITGGIVYNLWKVGKTEMLVSEGIFSDFHDTGYGIGGLLFDFEKYGFGDKIPPIHILPKEFINYQNDLQGSLDEWGNDIQLVKADISETEQRRLHLSQKIDFYKQFLEGTLDKSEDFRSTYQKILDDLIKEYDSIID
jgi:hypothetical protein